MHVNAGELSLHHLAWDTQRKDWCELVALRCDTPRALFAPANVKCSADNAAYRARIEAWLSQGCTLRYSGGMVPDVHHLLVKVCTNACKIVG